MYYPAQFLKEENGGYSISFRDIPEANSCGDDYDDAVFMAEDALLTALDFYFEDKRNVPAPSIAQSGDIMIRLPASAWAKVLLLNELVNQKVTQVELAKRLNVAKQQVTRIVNLNHATKIDVVESALHALGKELRITIGR